MLTILKFVLLLIFLYIVYNFIKVFFVISKSLNNAKKNDTMEEMLKQKYKDKEKKANKVIELDDDQYKIE